jgi:putative FmdB family regulatory protein
MARYDYRCSACGDVFEVEHPMGEKPAIVCPQCGAPAERVFDASGITFTGTGFYNTDMRDSGGSGSKGGELAKKGPSTLAKPASCPHKDHGCGGCGD